MSEQTEPRQAGAGADFVSDALGLAAFAVVLYAAYFLRSHEPVWLSIGVTLYSLLPSFLGLAAILALLGTLPAAALLPRVASRGAGCLLLVYIAAIPFYGAGVLVHVEFFVRAIQAGAAYLLGLLLLWLALTPLLPEWKSRAVPDPSRPAMPGAEPLLAMLGLCFLYEAFTLLWILPDLASLWGLRGLEAISQYFQSHFVVAFGGALGLVIAALGRTFSGAIAWRVRAAALFAGGIALSSMGDERLGNVGGVMMIPWLLIGLVSFVRRLFTRGQSARSLVFLLGLIAFPVLTWAAWIFRIDSLGPLIVFLALLFAAVGLALENDQARTASMPVWLTAVYFIVAFAFVFDQGMRLTSRGCDASYGTGPLTQWSSEFLWFALLLVLLAMRHVLRRRPAAGSAFPGAPTADVRRGDRG